MTGLITTRRQAIVFACSLLGAVVAPAVNLWREKPRDSFPLSHYPMFSARRGTHVTVTSVRGVDIDGDARPLDSRLAARGGMNQERKQIARAARRDRGDRVARTVAKRLARRDLHPDVVRVEVVRTAVPLDAYFAADTHVYAATASEVRGAAPVPGRQP